MQDVESQTAPYSKKSAFCFVFFLSSPAYQVDALLKKSVGIYHWILQEMECHRPYPEGPSKYLLSFWGVNRGRSVPP